MDEPEANPPPTPPDTDAQPPRVKFPLAQCSADAAPAVKQRTAMRALVDLGGAFVVARQVDGIVKDLTGDGVITLVDAVKASVQPRDAIEEMIAVQMLWTHFRLASLSRLATDQVNRDNVRVVNDAADRATGTFRKLVLALKEHRAPPRSEVFVAVKGQANVGHQQVIGHAPRNGNPAGGVGANEQGFTAAAAVPPVGEGVACPAVVGPAAPALGAGDGAPDGGGQGPVPDERPEARRADGRATPGMAGPA